MNVLPEHYLNGLKEVRPNYGTNKGQRLNFLDSGTRGNADYIRRNMENFPKEWVDSWEPYPIRSDMLSRANFSTRHPINMPTPIAEVNLSMPTPDRAAIHEMTHFREFTSTKLTDIEEQFYRRRTAGEPERRLIDIFPGSGYNTWEKTRLDKFFSPYIGKEYPPIHGRNYYEVATMGVENLLFVGSAPFAGDTEMIDLVLGMLAGL